MYSRGTCKQFALGVNPDDNLVQVNLLLKLINEFSDLRVGHVVLDLLQIVRRGHILRILFCLSGIRIVVMYLKVDDLDGLNVYLAAII